MFIVECPRCHSPIIIQELNCKIFRHAILKSNFEQINPHSAKEFIDELIIKNAIYGCGAPFEIINNIAVLCDYK